MIERELKYEADHDSVAPPVPSEWQVVGTPRSITLHARYWDTPDHRLLGFGVTLRHRTASDGSEEGWTLKLPSSDGSDGSVGVTRTEVDAPGPLDRPPVELTSLVRSVVGPDELSPVAELTTLRRIEQVGESFGEAVVEVVVDRVESQAGGRRLDFREYEAELLVPSRVDLLQRLEHLWLDAGLRPSGRGKLARVLGTGEISEPSTPPAERSISRIVESFIREGTRQLVGHELRLRVDDHDREAVHQARVATRRLRSNLKTFRPLLDRSVTDPLRDELRWAGGLLGAVRDADVLTESLSRLAEGPGFDRDGWSGIDALAADQATVARRNLASALEGDRYQQLLVALRRAADRPPLHSEELRDRPAAPAVRRLLRRDWKRLRGAVHSLAETPSDEALHSIRKDVKRMRYSFQVLRDLGLGPKGFVKQLGRIQDELGLLHDDVVARAWLAEHRDRLHGDALFLAGQLDQAAAGDAVRRRAGWPRLWRSVRGRRIA